MSRRGFALLAALWLLVALSVMSLGISVVTRARRLAAANAAERTQAAAAAHAGVEHLRMRLARRLAQIEGGRTAAGLDPWHGVDSLLADTITLGTARYTVVARAVGTALNVNRASEEELRRLFIALRIDAGTADRLAQRIVDWRDPDDLHHARGAERDAYLAAGVPDLPRNAPFQSLREIRSVLGMTAAQYDRVRPYLTVSGSGQVNLNLADRPVLLALPGMTEQSVGVVFRLRRQRRAVNLIDLPRELTGNARALLEARITELLSRTTTETREVVVASDGWIAGSPVRVRVTGLLVRARSAVFYVWSRTE